MPDLGLDELEAIGAIYGEDAIVRLDERMVELHLPNRHAVPRISLQLHLPRDYPATSPPLVSLACVPDRIDSTLLDWAASFVEILFIPEKEVLLDYIQWLGQQREMFGEGPEEADHDDREAEEVDPGGMPDLDGLRLEEEKPHPIPLPRIASDEEEVRIQMMAPRIVTGQPIVEKRSTFLAHCCRVNDVKEVRADGIKGSCLLSLTLFMVYRAGGAGSDPGPLETKQDQASNTSLHHGLSHQQDNL